MTECSLGDLVVLYLLSQSPTDTHSGDATTRSLATATDLGDTLSGRISLASELSRLECDGLVSSEATSVTGKRRYQLTDHGLEYAREFRDRLVETSVVVHSDGKRRELPLGDVPATYDISLVEALAARSPDGDIYLETDLETGLVGRTIERETLESMLGAAEDSRQIALITGEAGTGRTSLIEWLAQTADEQGFRTAIGRARRTGGQPYQPFRTALEAAPITTDSFPLDDEERLENTQEGMYDTQQIALYTRVSEWLTDRVDSQPLLLVLEDLQWADTATIDLFEYLLEAPGIPGLVLVATSRASAHTDDAGLEAIVTAIEMDDQAHLLELGPLERDEVGDLIERQLGQRGVPSGFVETVHERTGGNPLFVVETVQALRERGAIDLQRGTFPTADQIGVADAVQTTIRDRLERLDEEPRAILETGAVIGDTLSLDTLGSVLDADEVPDTVVDRLVEMGLWQRIGNETVRYHSDVIRSVVLEELDDDRRRRFSRRAGEILASEDGDDATIATHYYHGGCPRRAVDHWIAAGDEARKVYAHDDAIERYERALQIAHGQSLEDVVLDVLESLGDIYYTQGEYDQADKHFRYIRARTDDPERLRRTYRYQARMRFEQGAYDETAEAARAGLDIDGEPVTIEVCWLHDYLAGSYMKRGEYETAIEGFETQRDLAAQIDADVLLGRAYQNLGSCYAQTGEIEAGVTSLERGVSLLEGAGDERELARSLNDLAIVYDDAGRQQQAERTLRRGERIAKRTDNFRVQLLALNNLGVFAQYDLRWDDADEYYDELLELADRLDHDEYRSLALVNKAGIEAERGSLQAAIDMVERSLELIEKLGRTHQVVHRNQVLGGFAVLAGNLERATGYLEAGRMLATEHEFSASLADLEKLEGIIARARGDEGTALACHRSSLERALEVAPQNAITSHRLELVETLCVADQPEEALEMAETAVDELPDGYRLLALKTDTALGVAYRHAGHEQAREHLESVLERAEGASNEATLTARRELATLAFEHERFRAAHAHLEAGRTLARETGFDHYLERFEALEASYRVCE
ncbi:tetratricopeptide repeat protein [Halobacteria archaeon AArc-curdl1]|uniref:Tetratricopeptide repeat protein n=1 Tax=Natronosalvus hydrolyticus TaxID=2979988 RepID=A0AAP2Z713_9EURY|nr:tetratricopeptide repeat protein [Halobacteria archaeon AArc-curdl1]